MKHLPMLAALLIATPALAADTVSHPTAEFLTLPQSQRNLAVYDAFWDALERNYFDPTLVTTPDMRELRLTLREYAETENRTSSFYKRILGEVAAQLPASHVGAEPPLKAEAPAKPATGKDSELEQKLVRLLAYGPGYTGADVRRGTRTYGLVAEVMPGTPAEAAGIRPGWRVVRAASDLKLEDGAVKFAGEFVPLDGKLAQAWEKGELRPTVADQWKIVRITFDHKEIPVRAPIESRDLDMGVRYLRFDTFGDETFMNPVLESIGGAGAAGLIIDLRWNVGGIANQLQRVAGALLPDGATLGTMHNAQGKEVMAVTRSAARYQGPLVLLVGPGTGSGAEMLAAAVRDTQRGPLVGRMTNGSALVSEAFPLPDGGFARVPISDFTTATGKRIEGVGVEPDIRVMPTLEDVRAGRDTALEQALMLLQPGPAAASR